jgi:hypothetical protein
MTSAVLAWVFRPNDAVNNMDSRIFKLFEPNGCFLASSKPCFELDQNNNLLPLLGSTNQQRYERRVIPRSIQRHLDRKHIGLLDGLTNETVRHLRRSFHTGDAQEDLLRESDRKISAFSSIKRGGTNGVHGSNFNCGIGSSRSGFKSV